MIDPWGQTALGGSLSGIAKPEPWTENARCASVSSDWWFPEHGTYGMDARRVCNGEPGADDECPAKADCLAYALRRKERHGIWAGLSTKERIKLERTNGRGAVRCRICSSMFEPLTANVQMCSDECRRKSRRDRAARAAS